MAEVVNVEKQKRNRCSDEDFLKAVMSSKTYLEISEKTGQKLGTTIARYNRVKNKLAENGEQLPTMERSKSDRVTNNESLVDIVKRLKSANS